MNVAIFFQPPTYLFKRCVLRRLTKPLGWNRGPLVGANIHSHFGLVKFNESPLLCCSE